MKKSVLSLIILVSLTGCTRLSIPVGDQTATYTDIRNPFFERAAHVSISTNGTLRVDVGQTDAITEAKIKTISATAAQVAVKELKSGL